MSGEFLFELIDKAQWSFERKARPVEHDQSRSFSTAFKKWFSSSVTLSPNAERFLQQTGEKSTRISLHMPSNRLALVIYNSICVISLRTSEVLLEIPVGVSRSDQYNHLNCLAWSNNGKLLAYGHWSGVVCVYSTNDGQLLHELANQSLNRSEDSFVDIWFSGSDASQFIDLLCLKRTGELIRYVMSRDDIASCAEEKFPFHITCALIDSNQNQIYLVPFNTKSIFVWKIVDTNPSVIEVKKFIDDEANEIYIYDLALSPNESCLAAILSDQSVVLYQNNDYLRCLATLNIQNNRSLICDFDYWDEKTLILFYADGSMSFHEGQESLEEYRYESNQLHPYPHLCHRTSDQLFLIDSEITSTSNDETDEDTSNIISRLFRSLKDSTETISERLILIEHSDPDRLIESLLANGDCGGALRVCKVFNRVDLADQIHERESRLSSSQLNAHCTRIQSRLRVLQLCTTLLYPTFDEQDQLIRFGLNQATRKQLFNNLFYSDQAFSQSIYDENLHLKDMEEKNQSLSIPQKQILLYRRKLIDEKQKLDLYDNLMKVSKTFQQYQPNMFEKFREWDYKQIALRCAREGQLNELKLVLEHANPSISSLDLLTVLSDIPETIPLNEYEDLIPKLTDEPIERKKDDWSDKYLTSSEETKSRIDRSALVQWYQKRILSFEYFGFIENALQLCKHADEIDNFNEFSSLSKLLSLEYLLNKSSDQDLTLNQMQNMSEEEIFDLILTFKSDGNADDIDKRIQQILLPSMALIDQSNEYLTKNFIKKLQNNLDIYPIIRALKLKKIFPSKEFDQLIRELIFNVNSFHQISICQQLLTLASEKQDLEYIIESCRIFLKWSMQMIPSEMIRIMESEESLSNAIILLIQSAIRQEKPKINISTGNELYRDIELICRQRLSSQTLSNLFVSSLLKSDSIECFQIVRSMLSRFHIPLIIQAATDYIDSAKDGRDRSIVLAKHCLDLVDDPALVMNERNLIEAQNICDFFGYFITPLEIRRHPNAMQIIPAILKFNPQAYKNTSKLIALALYLQSGNKQEKKDQCMLYIAEYCLEKYDLNTCWELCSYLVEENYGPSWKCCWKLIHRNMTFMNETILSFISLHCDEILLDEVLKKSSFIRDESIPKDEYQITSTYSFYSNPFYDRDYTQQMEFKEIPLLKSAPIDEKNAIKYVNIDTPLFVMVYLASNTTNDIPIEKDNEYAIQLSIYCQSLMRSPIPRNLNAIPSSIIDKTLIENNETYNRLVQNRQYSILNQLDSSIDMNRFKTDSEYRRLTILGLFMCDNPPFDYGEQLAIKSDISIDECHHSYFEHLLTSSHLSLNEIRKKIKPMLNSERMKKNRQIKLDLVKRLHSNVFPLIDGKDYERLKLFYEIKKSLGDLTHAQKHIQAIQQLITLLNQDFDYKLFLSKPENFIEKYANDSNIIHLGLTLDQVKVSSSNIITSSWIYSYYLQCHPTSSILFDLLNRITSFEDFRSLVEHLLTVLTIPKRIELIEFSLKLIHSKDDVQWQSFDEFLRQHLSRFEILVKLSPNYSDEELNQLDQCVDDHEELLADLLNKHGQFDLIIYLKTRLFHQISIHRILQLTIEKISENQSDDEERLNALFESISLNEIDEKEFFSSLQSMCRSETINRRVRYKLIEKLDKMFDKQALQSDDLLLFEQYRLSNLLASFDSFTEIKKEEIETDEKRRELFEKYLRQAKRIIHFESLIQILNQTWAKQPVNQMKGSHGLTLKNELILSMIEKNSEWERILSENSLQIDEEEISALIQHLYNSNDLKSYAYKFWLIHPISSLIELLFRSTISASVIDKSFLSMSISRHRVGELVSINPSLFDYYLTGNLSTEEQKQLLNQLQHHEEFLLQMAQLFLRKEDYSSCISFGLIVDTLQKYFLK